MKQTSIWKDNSEKTNYRRLNGNVSADVAIIGGGITGITAAYLLAKAGKKVVVLEALKIAAGSTGYSTGNLYATVGHDGLHSIKSKWNEDVLKDVVASRAEAIDFIEQRIKQFKINCDFRRVPWCLFTNSDKQSSFINKEREAAEIAGLTVSDKVQFPLPVTNGFTVNGQAQFNPYEYVVALAENIDTGNCTIYENTKVTKVEEGDMCTIETTGGTVRAAQVIMATHTPKGIYKVHTSLGPYREYAVGVRLNGDYPAPGIYWDMLQNEHYSMRTFEANDGPVFMVLGESHKVGQKENNEECLQALEKFLRNRFDVKEVAYTWSAQNYRAADGIPYIGLSSGNKKTFIATGFAADGLTYGTLAAMIISDEILGIENKWKKTYHAARNTPLASAKEFIKENINVLGEYLKDFPGVADVGEVKEIQPGEGKVISQDGEKIAVYRDDNKKLHACSAVCTHMDCIVSWNQIERTWDCPCHGSRFDNDGTVLEGPAIMDLPKRKVH